jgi:site-specific DNA-methyltransferase (cytosine-N4-specific)
METAAAITPKAAAKGVPAKSIVAPWPPPRSSRMVFATALGATYQGLAEEVLAAELLRYQGTASLILTSPPFPLNRKKKYGNRVGEEYLTWLALFAPIFRKLIKPRGSIVIEMGNAWEAGRPVMSTLGLEALLRFMKTGKLQLCQQFVWNNPARLPTPVQWVNIKRVRVKDAFTHIWWMARSAYPIANNRRVLVPYSDSMLKLLKNGHYNSGRRPSEHDIGRRSFLTDNGGAIPSNVITLHNTHANLAYQRYCHENNIKAHPARMAPGLAEFFIKFLTKPGDIVVDPFAGSNTTGAAAQSLGRKWLAIEPEPEYIQGSIGRFQEAQAKGPP